MALGTNPAANSLMKIQFMKGTKMKKTRILKIAMTLAALALLACASVGIAVSAETSESMMSMNVAYNENTHIAVAIEAPADASVGIIVWQDETLTAEQCTFNNKSYTNYKVSESNGVSYYKTHAIASDEYADAFWVAPIVDGEIAETPVLYSVVRYIENRLDDTGVTEKQYSLYSKMLIHGIAADKMLGGNQPSYIVVKTVNGTVGEGSAYAAPVLDGAAVTISAAEQNADGERFLYWLSPDGVTEISERVSTVAPTEYGINTYTAVYGTAE